MNCTIVDVVLDVDPIRVWRCKNWPRLNCCGEVAVRLFPLSIGRGDGKYIALRTSSVPGSITLHMPRCDIYSWSLRPRLWTAVGPAERSPLTWARTKVEQQSDEYAH